MKTLNFTSNKSWKRTILLCSLVLCLGQLSAQVTGTKVVGTDYPTLTDAITDLNTVGISGPVVISIPAGYTETAPAGGYILGSPVLNASTSASSTLTIQRSGVGVSPLLTAPVGTSLTVDGIFIIQGTDYVTITGIDLTESAANTTPTTWMEWGYALVKLQNTAPFDGCQHVTIRNCVVTLNRLNTPTVGIYANNHIATATTALTITATSDAMNDCQFYGNTIQNCVTGISLRGFAAPSPYGLYDQNNDIGGSSGATGNIIRNYAGATTGAGINLQYQNNANVAFNQVNNMLGGGVAATSVIYGIYTQNGTNASVTVTNNAINLTQGTTSSALYGVNTSCAGSGTVSINNNRFTANGGSTGSMYMIYFGGANTNINTNSNSFFNINVATTGSLYMIYHSTASGTENITCNSNTTGGSSVPYVSKTGSGGTVAGYYNNAGVTNGFVLFNNNNFSNITMGGSSTFYGLFENDGGTGQNKFAGNNIVSNITSAAGTLYGLWMGFSASETFSNNTVTALNAGTGSAYGIYVNSSSNQDTVLNNTVNNLTSTGGNVYGIYISGGTLVNVSHDTVYTLSTSGTTGLAYGLYESGGTTVNIFKNKIYDIEATGTGSSVNGMFLNSGTVATYNNLIGDLRTPNYNGAGGTQLAGIYVGGGTAHTISYNSVYVNGTSTGAAFGSCAIYNSTTPAVTLRNNIFVNTSTPKGAGLTVAYRRSSTTLTTYQAASNNNLFYAGTPGPSNVIFYDGTTSYSSLASYKALVAPRDANSVTENPPFASTTGSSSSFLHITSSTPTQVESGGINIAGITDDAEGSIRAGNPGYSGTGTAPDLGAIEGNYIIADLSAPGIAYTILPDACTTGDRSFTATITDATGVPISGSLVPRVYFRKGAGAWFSNPGTLSSGSSTSGIWSFTISAAPLGGLAIGDIVSYFIIAQDIVATPNIGANPGAGLVASDVNTISTFPTTPNTYTVIPVLSGTYTVGAGMAYTKITDAVAAYNASCVSGNVVFQLTDATYPSETFPITINANASASPSNTLTIKPATGISPTITGSSTSALFVLNGADYVTIDGSNNAGTNSVCPAVALSRDMTISNTSTSTTSAVVWIQTTTVGDSATHNTIKNCNIAGSGNSFTLFGIGSGGTAISYTSLGKNNNSNRIENNNITATQTGIYSMGASAANKNTGTVINQNHMDGTAPANLRNNGIFTGFEDGILISGNFLANITNGISNDIIGINLGFGNNAVGTSSTTGNDVTNATVTNNKLDNITQTNTYTCLGIAVAGVPTGINTIANNMLSEILSKGTAGDFSSGIFIGGATGGTTRVYYNSVDMSGTLTGASYPTFAISISGTNPIVDLKNNIFTDHASTGSTLLYAIGLAYTTYSNLSSDHNDFFTVGANMGTVGSLTGTGTDQASLTAWQATTGKDANSKEVDPAFTSPSDLHLTLVSANIPLMDAGIPVAITNDFDCNARSSTTPDMGINEFNIPLCSSVTAGTAAPGTAAFCNSGSTTINLTGATVGIGITYQWESSADSATWVVIPGATNDNYTTPSITATTFYRVKLLCTYSGITDSATTKVTINPLPVISVTPDGGAICSSGTGLTMTASGASTYTWSPATGLSATTGASVNANPPATLAYTVTGTDVLGCVGTHVSTISVTDPPGTFSVTPTPTNLCPGNPAVLLSASGPVSPSAGPDSAASGVISLVVPDATPAGTGTSVSISGIPAGATITNVTVRFNTTMTFDGDLVMNLTAPNSKTLNLVNRRGGSGDNFANTIVTSAGGITFASSAAPFTDIYSADAALAVGPTGSPSNTSLWSDLYSVPNGTWTFNARDYAGGDVATIDSWSLVIDYTYNPTISWSPLTGLFTDAGATVPYTGSPATDIYALPGATTTYIATLTLGGCTGTASALVNVIPAPNADTIHGPNSVCRGSSVAFTDTASGGVWYSTNSNATVSGTGLVTGVTTGTDTILYVVTNLCSADTASKIITIDVFPVAGTISGLASVCEGSSITLSDASPGGVWSSSSANATVSTTGLVNGVTAGAATISYIITNGCGADTATKSITVNPLPHAGSITGPVDVCQGSSILLSDAAPGGVWNSSNSTASVSGGIVIGLAGGVDTIWYIVTNGCGADTASHVVTVGPLPVAGTITGPAAVCVGSSVALSDAVPGGTWIASNAHATITGTGSLTGISAGVDTIAYSVTNTCGTATATLVVTINPLPDAGIITGPSFVCKGATVTMTDAAPGGTWSSSDISVATVTSFGIVTGVAAGAVTISYTATVICGTATATKSVSVDPAPTKHTITGGGTFCAGGTGVDVALSGSDAGISYQLYRGTIPVGGALAGTGTSIDFGLETGAGTYTVLATNTATGCSDTMTGTATINVNPTIPPSVVISYPTGTICAGSAVTFTAVPINGGATPTYQWQVNGISKTTGDTYTYVPVNGDIVRVIITSSPCAIPDTGSTSVKVDIAAFTKPSVSITVDPGTTICQGSNATFTAVPVLGGTSPFLRWTKNGVNVATGPTYTYVPNNGDVVYVLLGSNYPCRSADTVISPSVKISTVPVRVPTLAITADPGTSINFGQMETLTAVVGNVAATPSYQWYINGIPITGATNSVFARSDFFNHDSVTCVVTSNSVCHESVSRYVIISVGRLGITQTTGADGDINVIPNPNKGEFIIRGMLGSAEDEEVTFDISDMLGQVVFRSKFMVKAGNVDERVIMSNVANGMYLLNFHSRSVNKTVHIIVAQ